MFTFSLVDWKIIHVPTNHDNYKRSIRCMAIKQWRREQGFSIKAIPLYLANITDYFIHVCPNVPVHVALCFPICLFSCLKYHLLLHCYLLSHHCSPKYIQVFVFFFFHLKLDGPIFWLLQYQIIFCKNKLS